MANLNEAQKKIFNSSQEINLFMGGTGSGKTYLDGCLSADFAIDFPHVYGFVAANTYQQLNLSTLKRIRDVWRDVYKWREGYHYVVGVKPPKGFDLKYHNFDNYSSIISFRNGAVIFKGSLENYEVHSGKEFGWALCDESWMTKEEAIREVILARLRQTGIVLNGKKLCPLYITTTPSKAAWINEMFRLDDFEQEINSIIYDPSKFFYKEYDNKCVTICSIYQNSSNLPPNYIPNLINEHTDRNGKLKESGKRLIFANPFVRAGGEFYSSFDRITHTGDVPYLEGLPIHISFDFNVVPYITMTVWQVQRKDNILWLRQIDEFCLKSPLNKTEKLCQEFERHYSMKLRSGLLYYGDATGKNQDTRGLNDYQIVERALRLYLNNFSKRVAYRNPSVSDRRQFINNILDEKYNVRILIDRKCRETIRDMEFTKEDATGHKLKEKVKDELTGQSYEPLGHCFVKGTKIETINGIKSIEEIRRDDFVLTRGGYCRVKKSFLSRKNTDVKTYKIAEKLVTCTSDHPVFTQRGFIEIKDLKRNDLIFKRNDKWKQQCSMGSNLSGIPKQKEEATGYITRATSGGMGLIADYTCIAMFGNFIMEKSLKAALFITRTGIHLTTKLRTLFVSLQNNMRRNILKIIGCEQDRGRNIWNLCGNLQRIGINQKTGTNGIPNTQRHQYWIEKKINLYVRGADVNTKDIVRGIISSVQSHAKWQNGEIQEGTARKGFVLFVGKRLRLISILKLRHADVFAVPFSQTKQDVYNLSIENNPEFFANGILVHNCSDSLDYFVTNVEIVKDIFKKEFKG